MYTIIATVVETHTDFYFIQIVQINHLILYEFFYFQTNILNICSFQRSSACQQLADYQSVLEQEFA